MDLEYVDDDRRASDLDNIPEFACRDTEATQEEPGKNSIRIPEPIY